jgi:exodeoxyribonuclease-3
VDFVFNGQGNLIQIFIQLAFDSLEKSKIKNWKFQIKTLMQIGQSLVCLGINPNGIRAYCNNAAHEIKEFCNRYSPDIVVFNETKGNEDKQKEMSTLANKAMPGYFWFWNNGIKPGYAGTAVAVKPNVRVLAVDYGFGTGEKEPEGRLITLELESCFVVGLYGVNAGSERLDYKIIWLTKLITYLERLKTTGKIVIALGDWNVAPQPIDIHDPINLQYCAGFTQEERACFAEMLKLGWIDIFRYLHPHQVAYTFFSGRSKKQGGWRIDHMIIDEQSVKTGRVGFEYFDILTQDKGSDHVPIVCRINIRNEVRIEMERRIEKKMEYRLPELNLITVKAGEFHAIDQGIWRNPFKLEKTDKKDVEKRRDSLVKYEVYIREKIAKEINVFQPMMLELITKNVVLTCKCRRGCHGKIIIKILSEFIEYLQKLN